MSNAVTPIEFIREQQHTGRGTLTPEEHRAALAWAESGEGEPPEALDILEDEIESGSVTLKKPETSLVQDRPEAVDPSVAARAREQERRPGVEASDPSVQAQGKLKEAQQQRRLLRGRVPIEDAETGVREDEGVAAVGDPMTAPEEQGQTPEERDAEARWQQTAKFFRTAAGGTAIQGAAWGVGLMASPAFRESFAEWQAYKEKRDANALGRDRMEAAEGLVYPALFRYHATAMRNMVTAIGNAGGMSANDIGQIMRAGAKSLMDSSVKAAQFVASEREKGIKDDTTLGREAAATLNDALKEGVGFVDTFIGDLAVQQGRKAAGEALEQVAPQLNKIQDPEVRRKTWAAIQAASERGDKQAVFDLLNRALATNPAGAATPATESAPAQGTAAPANQNETPRGRMVEVPQEMWGGNPDFPNEPHWGDGGQRPEGWTTIDPTMPIEVEELQKITPADRQSLSSLEQMGPWTPSQTTPGWFVSEQIIGGEVRSYIKSPDGKIWGDDQVEDYIEGAR